MIKLEELSEEMINILTAALGYQEASRKGCHGQAFTTLKCNWCAESFLVSNTGTVIFCKKCTKELSDKIKEKRGFK